MLWDRTYGLLSLSEKTRKSNSLQMPLQRQHFLTPSVCSARVSTRDLKFSRPLLFQPSETGGGHLPWLLKKLRGILNELLHNLDQEKQIKTTGNTICYPTLNRWQLHLVKSLLQSILLIFPLYLHIHWQVNLYCSSRKVKCWSLFNFLLSIKLVHNAKIWIYLTLKKLNEHFE